MASSEDLEHGSSRSDSEEVEDQIRPGRQDAQSRPETQYNMSDMSWVKVDTDDEKIPRMARIQASPIASSESDLDFSVSESSVDCDESSLDVSTGSDVEVVYQKITAREAGRNKRPEPSDLESSSTVKTDRNAGKVDRGSANYNSLSLMWCLEKFEPDSSTSSSSRRSVLNELPDPPPRRRSFHDNPSPGTSGTSTAKRIKKVKKSRRSRRKAKHIEKVRCLRRKLAKNRGKSSKRSRGHRDVLRDVEIESSPEAYRNRTDEALDFKEEAVERAIAKNKRLKHCHRWGMYLVKNPKEDDDQWVALPMDE